jgi:glucosyl-3-phosphoglycerate synthase
MNEPTRSATVRDWLTRRTYHHGRWLPRELSARKDGRQVSVVIPARDEQATIGSIVTTVRRRLVRDVPLVDEIIVVDSRSRDRTAEVAAAAGATVVGQDDVLPALEPLSGKGDALWKGLAASSGDVVAFVDGDLRDFSAHFVTGLLGPLLTDPEVCYVKGFYRRALEYGDKVEADGGGRVTELVARPLLNLFWPELAGFVQPLAGEYAGRRSVLTRLPFVADYGVEVGHLIDLLSLYGLDGLAQVDLDVRRHSHQTTHRLGVMSAQIMQTVFDRLGRAGRLPGGTRGAMTLTQFHHSTGPDLDPVDIGVSFRERPPLAFTEVARWA